MASSPIRRGKGGKSDRFPLLGLQNHCGRWLQPWNQRWLLLDRKAMTNLDGVLKRRDMPLRTKVCIVMAIVFPVVTCSCERWTLKKVEHQRINAFELQCWRRLLKVPGTVRRSNQSILREINPECSLEELRLKLKIQYFDYMMRTDDSLEKSLMLGKIEGRRRQHQWMIWLDSITDAMNMNLSKLWEMVRGRDAWCAAVHGVAKSQTWLGNWATTKLAPGTKKIGDHW